MTVVYICECEHPKSQHKRERDGCRALDCGCSKFEADMAASAAAQGVTPTSAPEADDATPAIDGESTSARLRRVERERDELAEEVQLLRDAAPCGWCDGLGVAPAERFGRDADGAPNYDEDQPCPEGCEIPGWLAAERNDAADNDRELAILRADVEERAKAGLLLEAELATARAELARAREQVDGMRQANARLLRSGTAAAGDVLDQQHRYVCETCGARYGQPFTDHEHGPLTPVTVTITRGVTTA